MNEVSAANVVRQVAELLAAERVVAEVLDDGAAISIGMRLLDLVFRQSRKSLEQQRPDLTLPEQVYNLFVRQNGVCGRAAAGHQQDQEYRKHSDAQEAPIPGNSADRRQSPNLISGVHLQVSLLLSSSLYRTPALRGFVCAPGALAP